MSSFLALAWLWLIKNKIYWTHWKSRTLKSVFSCDTKHPCQLRWAELCTDNRELKTKVKRKSEHDGRQWQIQDVSKFKQKLFWQVRTSTSSDTELLETVLGLLVNITTEPTDTLREFGQRVCGHCRSLLPSQCSNEAVPQRALTVMGNILPHSVPAVECICDHGGTELLLNYIKVSDCVCV